MAQSGHAGTGSGDRFSMLAAELAKNFAGGADDGLGHDVKFAVDGGKYETLAVQVFRLHLDNVASRSLPSFSIPSFLTGSRWG